jgi:hypothetical protein
MVGAEVKTRIRKSKPTLDLEGARLKNDSYLQDHSSQ